ncbi:membrane fusion protein, multidrug efflux system [Tistlia consotensis]|uniref:Membrane fusion protein, multidrug efflux system n=1 Tax=Tistlia consotensis USBA 355 TaxID=560819 RepID=A0A1Y6BI31_9PROT|nr:HlyD family secretion protein [Tistlia consotensis]SMF12887.1 membrane fusion protein, multidrug efflux system [Tistlia consotensis USBA 355]SNR50847.1 membrane fusion protein, multidrug efflux system [Tistlia consotensis]
MAMKAQRLEPSEPSVELRPSALRPGGDAPEIREERSQPNPAPARPAAPAPAPAPATGGPGGSGGATPPRKRGRGRLLLLAVVMIAGGLGAWQGWRWWTQGRFLVSTDDAYVQADLAILSPKVSGYVAAVLVEENQPVKAGQPVVQLDDGDLRLALEAAEAKVETQQATLTRIAAQIDAAHQQVAKAEAARGATRAHLTEAEADYRRKATLVARKVSSPAELDTATAARDAAAADLKGSDAAVAAAGADVAVLQAQLEEAQQTLGELQVQRRIAARDLSFATIRAPFDGLFGNRQVQAGDYVTPGRQLGAVAPLDKVFIEANFKETDLAGITAGERATITVDALPGVEIEGRVASLSPASGSVFSLLPPENATGNFTKITQRLPVRIEVPAAVAARGVLRPGLSVVVEVDKRTAPAEATTRTAGAD